MYVSTYIVLLHLHTVFDHQTQNRIKNLTVKSFVSTAKEFVASMNPFASDYALARTA